MRQLSRITFYIISSVTFFLLLSSFYIFSPVNNFQDLRPAILRSAHIPNIVHYVWIKNDGHDFALGFKEFVSIYSSHLYIRPDTIYIHTDASISEFDYAKLNGDEWTRRILNLPKVTYHHVDVPTQTTKGVGIGPIEHKSDFVRTEMLAKFGGTYLDMDAIPLRDIASLRKSGFATIVGMEVTTTSIVSSFSFVYLFLRSSSSSAAV